MEFLNRAEAHSFLASLGVGDTVHVVAGSKSQKVTVQRALRRTDGPGFGPFDHAAVTVGFGSGRWNVEVTPAALVDGRVLIGSYSQPKSAA